MSDPARSIFFGLRTNVQFFASRTGFAALEARLKVFSLLYDQVIVERGVYEAHIGEQGSSEWVISEPANARDLSPIRTRVGSPFGLVMQREGSNVRVPMINTSLVRAYRSQFYSPLKGAVAAKVDWVGFADFGVGGMHAGADNAADELYRRWDWDERELIDDSAIDQRQPKVLRKKAFESLNRDMARAVVLGLALAPDGIHAPMLGAKAARNGEIAMEPSGTAALALVLPDVRSATWEDIAGLRTDPALRYFRDRMRELEADAGSQALLEDAVRQALLQEVERKMPKWGATALMASINVVASPIPGVSTVATGLTAAQSIADTWREKHRWTATLLRARRQFARSKSAG